MQNDWTIDGILPVIATPFDADAMIDFDALRRQLEYVILSGAAGVILPAYSSEFYKLIDDERAELVRVAIQTVDGRLPVFAQANHGSALQAAAIARRYQEFGADAIAVALPRTFGLSDADQLVFARTVADAVSIPLLVQDFNPGGVTVDAQFAQKLADTCANFRYLKLEEPYVGEKVRSVIETTGGRVGVLEGWGGIYMLELIPAGICGIIPSAGMVDLQAKIYKMYKAGNKSDAFELFKGTLPYLNFGLPNMEVLHYLDKHLLVARGVMSDPHIRQPTRSLDEPLRAYAQEVIEQVLITLDRAALPRRPLD